MGFTELVKNLLLGGGNSIQSGDYVKTNTNSDTSDDELSIAEENQERDEYDVFGESVASKLRMIELEKVKLKVLRDIDAIICDAILGQGIYGPLTRKLKKSENIDSNGVSSTCDDELPKVISNEDNILPYY